MSWDSAAYDRWIRETFPERRPLRRDPVLWEVFAPLRPKARPTIPSHCTNCNRPVRPCRASKQEYPDTVRYHGNGVCNVCAKDMANRKSVAA